MLKNTKAFGSFSVDDSEKAHRFYGETLGMDISLVGCIVERISEVS